jgi:hypothetical protein
LKHLEIHIKGENQDDDDVDIIYYRKGSKDKFDSRLQIKCEDFSIGLVRTAIRDAIIYDMNPPADPSKDKNVDTWLKESC